MVAENMARLLSLRELANTLQLATQRRWNNSIYVLHTAYHRVPIKRASLSDVNPAQRPGAGGGHAGHPASQETQTGR
jgi:hypothetical protein